MGRDPVLLLGLVKMEGGEEHIGAGVPGSKHGEGGVEGGLEGPWAKAWPTSISVPGGDERGGRAPNRPASSRWRDSP